MKKLILSVCAVVVVSVAIPVFAAGQSEVNNDCLFYGKNCPKAVNSLPERIAKLKVEIARSEALYTPDELKLLEQKLKEENRTMRTLQKPGK